MTLNPFTASPASGAVALIRLYVGLILVGEGIPWLPSRPRSKS
ncbi:MAG TPA: hypothetical protein VH185_09895 [Mycobacterium sp.]|jgi:hypothetical protein|nr:hypothetical protein [Mycobacterium sp.]